MNWQATAEALGVPIHGSPDIALLITAAVLVAGAYALGWLSGSRLGPRVAGWWRHRTGVEDNRIAGMSCSVIRYGVTSLLLLIAGNAVPFGPVPMMLIAAGMGLSVGLLVYHVAAGTGLGTIPSAIIAVAAFVAAAAGTLGGLEPLVAGLGKVGFAVGTRRFTLLSTINFVFVAAALFVVARIINRLLGHSIARLHGLDVSQRVLLQKLAGVAVVVVSVLFGIDLLGIDLTALAVFSGAFGLAVGFGLQKTFGNLISGLILLMDRSVKPGDVIVVGDTFGAVNKIGVRAISVVTRDGKEHLIPNELLMTERVENWSYSSRNVRVHIPVGVGYDSDLALAQRLMLEAATSAERVLARPAPTVWLRGFGDSAVDHEILVWIADPELGVGNVQSEVLNKLWVLFKDNGIEIPFPQRDLHIRSMPPELLRRGAPEATM